MGTHFLRTCVLRNKIKLQYLDVLEYGLSVRPHLDATHTTANTPQREPHWAKNKLIARRGQDQGNTTRLTLVSPKAAGAPVSRVTLHCSNWATARAVAETSPSVLLDFLARVLSSGYLGRRPIPTQSALNGSIEWRRSDQHRPGDADSPTIARN